MHQHSRSTSPRCDHKRETPTPNPSPKGGKEYSKRRGKNETRQR